ncbi:ribonuclease H-like domain-containing protein [Tanacetum coccineum]
MVWKPVTQWILQWWRNPNWMKIHKGKAIDPTRYRGMIDTLMYLTSSRPDLVFDLLCACCTGIRHSLPKALTWRCAFADADHAAMFWYTVKKVKESESYEFLLANKKCIVDAKVFRKIMDICPRVEGEEFTPVQDDDDTHTFLTDLGYKGKKTVDVSQETVDVSEESEPEPTKRRITSRRVVKKKVTISADDNIIPDLDATLEIMTESVPELAKKKTDSRSTRSVVIQDTPNVMQALKESKKTDRKQPGTGGSSEGTGRIPGVPDESTVVSTNSSEGTGIKPEVPDEEKVSTEEKEDYEKKDDTDDDKSIDLEMTVDEETDDEILEKGDAEMSDVAKADAEKTEEAKDDSKKAELPPTSSSLSVSLGFGGQFLKLSSDTSLTGTVKDTTDVEISSLLDIKIQSEVPHIQSPSVLKVLVFVISEPSVLTPVQETPLATPVTTLPPLYVSNIPPAPLQQSTTPIPTPPITTDAPTITTAVLESDALSAVQLKVAKLEKDVFELKKIDHSAKALATLKSQVLMVVEQYLGSKIAPKSSRIKTLIINLEQEYEKSASEILKIKKEQAKKEKMPKYTIKSTYKESLKEYDKKITPYQTMHENKSFNKNPANHRLYHALMEALIEDENAMDKGVADTVKDHKRKHDDDEDPPAGPNQVCVELSILATTLNRLERSILNWDLQVVSELAMKMEHYLAHTNYPIWEVIQRGNGPVSVSTDTNGVIKVLPPKTAEEILARERERKARTTLLMALPEDHLAKFHKMTDAKKMWEAIKSRFSGNDESKKMQKYILKEQFEGFSVSNSEGLHKGYDRFQTLLSQLEIHGAGVSTEDANQKFLRSLPSAWSQISLIMRTKPGVDSLSFDDLYNNLRVFEPDVKGSTASSSSTQNVTFVSENTSSTNEVSTAYGASSSSGHNPQREGFSSYTDELMYSFFANQSSGPQLDHEDLEQLDEFDLEEMDLKWQVAMISMRLKKFYKKTGRKLQFDAKEPVGFDKAKVECYNCHKTGHFVRECRSKGNQDSRKRDAGYTGYKAKDSGRRSGKQEEPKALVSLDGEGVDWTSHSEDEQENYALMAYSNSGSDTEIRFMKIDLDDKTDVLTYHKKLLAEAKKEKEELKAKVEKWHNSSKSLNILLNSQMSARDKAGLGYGDQMNKGVLSYENEVFGSLFNSRSSDIEDSLVNDRYAEGMHAVPPPMIGIYIPSGPDKEIDDSQFTYSPKQSKPSEFDARNNDFNSCESNSSKETLESMPEPVVNEPKVVSLV